MKILKTQWGTALIAGAAALLPGLVYASTAANTTITNTVTVNFEDAANNAQTPVTASVNISVNLVASAPLLTSPADVDPTTENTGVNLIYTITGTANGPDSYDFSSVDTPANMNANAAFTTPSVTLGGTTTAAAVAAASTTVTVPFDGTDDSVVNGIAVGDTIVIDPTGGSPETFVVSAIDESTGAASNTVTITLDNPTTGSFASGLIIGEAQNVTVTVTTDTITTGTSGTHTVSTTATSQTAPNPATTQATATVITVRRPVLAVTKFVRNVTSPVVGGGTTASAGGNTFYTSGVSGAPGDAMEYLIVVDNSAAGAGQANNVVVSDPVPLFTSFVAGSIQLDPSTGTFGAQTEAADDGDAAELDATGNGTVFVYAGNGGDDSAVGAGIGAGGSLAAGDVSRVLFQVTID